jgi:hypothetical protein
MMACLVITHHVHHIQPCALSPDRIEAIGAVTHTMKHSATMQLCYMYTLRHAHLIT